MVSSAYIPDRGHIVWVTQADVVGHEQAGHRPALVLTPASANAILGMATCCPITSKVKGFPFEVAVPKGSVVEGVVLVDQIRSFDWRKREVKFICIAPTGLIEAVAVVLAVLLPFRVQ